MDGKQILTRAVLLVIGYVFGLFESGYFYGKLHGIDIRTKGSGNIGATNTLRVFGPKAGAIILLCDFLKCFLPCMIAGRIFPASPFHYISILYMGLGVTLGHNFPFYLGFRGGKGIACAAGMVFALDWKLGLIVVGIWAVITAITRLVSLASIVAAFVFVVLNLMFADLGLEYQILCVIIGMLAIVRHSANIERLLRGTESKIRL